MRVVVKNTLIEVGAEQFADAGGIGGREQIGTDVLGADGIGFGLFVVLALVIAANGHGKTEADNQAEKSEGRGEDDVKVVALVGHEIWTIL